MVMPKGGKGQTKREKDIRVKVLNKCWEYIHDNFHKLNEKNKLKVCLELSKKNIPQESFLEGQIKVTQMPTIKLDTGQDFIPNIGEPVDSPGDTETS